MEQFGYLVAGVGLVVFGLLWFVGGFIVGRKIWKEDGFLSMWYINLWIESFKCLFHLDIEGFRKYSTQAFITIMYGFFSFAPWILIFVFSVFFGGGSTYNDGANDARRGISPRYPADSQYMQGYNDNR